VVCGAAAWTVKLLLQMDWLPAAAMDRAGPCAGAGSCRWGRDQAAALALLLTRSPPPLAQIEDRS
jgi:hypothetical protein